MQSTREQIREEIKNVFEASRETPGRAYDEKEMVWHLVSNSKGRNSIHNTFKGKRKLSKFLKALEVNYLICFSLKDWETLKSLDQLEERIIFLIKTPKSSLASIGNTLKQRPPDMLAILIFILSLPVAAISVKLLGLIGFVVLVLPVVVILKVFQMHRKEVKFYQ